MTLAPDLTYAAQRTMQVLEVLAFTPVSAQKVADTLDMHPRTIRRTLRALLQDGYVERIPVSPTGYRYRPTMHLIALAAQFARHLPLVAASERVVHELHADTGLGAYAAAPAYDDVLVFASAGNEVPRPWELRPATEDAGGRALLAHRESWRARFAAGSAANGARGWLGDVLARGYACCGQAVAVPVPSACEPMAAIVLMAPPATDKQLGLIGVLADAAERLAVELQPVEPVR